MFEASYGPPPVGRDPTVGAGRYQRRRPRDSADFGRARAPRTVVYGARCERSVNRSCSRFVHTCSEKMLLIRGFMAVTVGFEPTVGGYPTQLFESCTFGRSDTSPPKSLRHDWRCRESNRTEPPASARSTTDGRRRARDHVDHALRLVDPHRVHIGRGEAQFRNSDTVEATLSGVDSGFTPIIAVFSISS